MSVVTSLDVVVHSLSPNRTFAARLLTLFAGLLLNSTRCRHILNIYEHMTFMHLAVVVLELV